MQIDLALLEKLFDQLPDVHFHATVAEGHDQDLQAIDPGKAQVDVLRLFLSADGHRQWCISATFPVRDEGGAVVGRVGVSRTVAQPDNTRVTDKRLSSFVERLESPDRQGLRIGQIAAELGLSMDTLERLCREAFGMKPKQILMRMRLDRACGLLEQGSASIAEIAAECGYADHSAFSRQFKAATLRTPQQYRAAVAGRPGRAAQIVPAEEQAEPVRSQHSPRGETPDQRSQEVE